jgi:hypothetical protein
MPKECHIEYNNYIKRRTSVYNRLSTHSVEAQRHMLDSFDYIRLCALWFAHKLHSSISDVPPMYLYYVGNTVVQQRKSDAVVLCCSDLYDVTLCGEVFDCERQC